MTEVDRIQEIMQKLPATVLPPAHCPGLVPGGDWVCASTMRPPGAELSGSGEAMFKCPNGCDFLTEQQASPRGDVLPRPVDWSLSCTQWF